MENNEVFLRLSEVLENMTKVNSKTNDVLEQFIKNNNNIVESLENFEKFANSSHSKLNEMICIMDALAMVIFESGVVKQERFQEVLTELIRKNFENSTKKNIKEEKNTCGCEDCSSAPVVEEVKDEAAGKEKSN